MNMRELDINNNSIMYNIRRQQRAEQDLYLNPKERPGEHPCKS